MEELKQTIEKLKEIGLTDDEKIEIVTLALQRAYELGYESGKSEVH